MLPIFICIFAGCTSFIKKQETSQCEHTETVLKCVQYVKNYDGDTVTFNISGLHPIVGKNVSVRVRGVDTPEIKGTKPCEKQRAIEAKAMVHDLLKDAKSIELRNIQRGKYFRIVAEVYADGKSLADKLIEARLAYLYDGGRKLANVDWCKGIK